MRPATRVMRRAAIARGGLPATENVVVNAATVTMGSVVGAANAVAALSDFSDASYVGQDANDEVRVVPMGFADLVSHGGRGIASFDVRARVSYSGGVQRDWLVTSFTGLTPTPTNLSVQGGSSPGDIAFGPFVKSGGGNFTVAEINSMTCRIGMDGAVGTAVRLYEASVTVTYA